MIESYANVARWIFTGLTNRDVYTFRILKNFVCVILKEVLKFPICRCIRSCFLQLRSNKSTRSNNQSCTEITELHLQSTGSPVGSAESFIISVRMLEESRLLPEGPRRDYVTINMSVLGEIYCRPAVASKGLVFIAWSMMINHRSQKSWKLSKKGCLRNKILGKKVLMYRPKQTPNYIMQFNQIYRKYYNTESGFSPFIPDSYLNFISLWSLKNAFSSSFSPLNAIYRLYFILGRINNASRTITSGLQR